jgi:hypothetical protein
MALFPRRLSCMAAASLLCDAALTDALQFADIMRKCVGEMQSASIFAVQSATCI